MAGRTLTEKDYLALAKKKTHRPSQLKTFPKVLVYSRNKKGKTTFGLSAGVDKTICLDPEHGTDELRIKNPYVWPVKTWNDVQEFWGALRTLKLSPFELGQGDSKEPFKVVSIDGLTKLNKAALRFIRKIGEQKDVNRIPGITDRRDYFKSGELMTDFITNLHSLPMGVVFTAQERMITGGSGENEDDEDVEDPEAFFVPDLPAGVRSTINQVVDVIGRLYVVEITKRGKQIKERRLQIGVHNKYDTGYRSEYELPDVLRDPTYPKLVQLMRAGKTRKA